MLVFNIIIVSLLVHMLIAYHVKSDVIACGLFAFIGSSASKFNWDRFNYLGVANDSRGGDSCGVVTQDFFKYGIGTSSNYEKFIIKAKDKPEGKYKVVLGHTRKASIGGIDLDYAQPYIFTSKSRIIKRLKKKNSALSKFVDSNSSKDTIVFAGIHNGTINNYKELAKKYNISAFDKNDSGVLMEIILKYGFDVLLEYRGTAAIIVHNYAENLSYVFRGSSPMYSKNAVNVEERPLYAYKESPYNTYFSSLKDSLLFIGGKEDNIVEVDPNFLYKIQNGKILEKIKMDRSDVTQREPVTTSRSVNSRNFNDTYEDHWGFYGYEGGRTHNSAFNEHNKEAEIYIGDHKLCKSAIQGKMHIMNETKPYNSSVHEPGSLIKFWKGRYMFNDVLINGVIHINNWGKRIAPDEHGARPFFFVDGVMITDRTAYENALKIVEEHNGTPKELARNLAPLSIYPVHSYDKSGERKLDFQDFYKPSSAYVEHVEDKNSRIVAGRVHFNGEFSPVFSKRVYIIRNGDLQGISENTWQKSPNEEFGTLTNPKKPNTDNVVDNVEDTPKIIALPQNIEDFPDCPCYDCSEKDCEKCVLIDEYIADWKEYNNAKEQAELDIRQAELADADAAYNAAYSEYENETYKELYEKQMKTILEDCSQSIQEAIEELYSLGPADTSTELEDILNVYRNSLIKFEEKHLSKF